jgi:hypothetical protein
MSVSLMHLFSGVKSKTSHLGLLFSTGGLSGFPDYLVTD